MEWPVRAAGRWICGAVTALVGLTVLIGWATVIITWHRDLPILVLAILTVGINLTIWGSVGILRRLDETIAVRRTRDRERHTARLRTAIAASVGAGGSVRLARAERTLTAPGTGIGSAAQLGAEDIAILIPAHNEELVIADSIASVARLVPRRNIHVVSDASTDDTVRIARECGVNVLDLSPNKGKAGALEAAVEHFGLNDRFEAVLILDADSQLDERYLVEALPMFDDPQVAAVAGYAHTVWRPHELTPIGKLITAYRDRLYTLQQILYKFGQTWRRLNVAYIVPGFASVYRTRALREIDMNPPGLIIEDFNMTFQLHRRRLGRIGFTPKVRAMTQDPDNVGDYVRQVRRWSLGFWQTIRHNGVWPSVFWLTLGLIILESTLAAAALLLSVGLVVLLSLPTVTDGLVLSLPLYDATYTWVHGYLPLWLLLFAVVVPDYLLTCIMATVRQRPWYLLLGLGFPVLRVIDAALMLWTLPKAWTTRSSGVWRSPTRR